MTQVSYPWDGLTVGDAVIALYSSQEFARDWFQLAFVYDRTAEGVIDTGFGGLTGGLIVAAGAGVVTVNTGAAIVDGRVYKNDAQITLTPDNTPSTRVDRVILRCDQTAQTVRAVILKGVDGSGTPSALTQNTAAGGTWEISLAKFTVTPGPTIGAVTSEARAIRTPLGPGYQWKLLPADDNAFATVGGWNSIGAGTSITLGPGKWLVWAAAIGQVLSSPGLRRLRIEDTTSSFLVGEAITTVTAANDYWNMTIPPQIYAPTIVTTLELQYYAGAADDIVYGATSTAIIAIRVI